jgi:hypothetical protein
MSDDDIDAFIEAGCRLLDIPVRDAWRGAIRLHLAVSLDHAGYVATFDLPEDAEPAPVFTA